MVDGQKKGSFCHQSLRIKAPAGRNLEYKTCQNLTFLLEPKKVHDFKTFFIVKALKIFKVIVVAIINVWFVFSLINYESLRRIKKAL